MTTLAALNALTRSLTRPNGLRSPSERHVQQRATSLWSSDRRRLCSLLYPSSTSCTRVTTLQPPLRSNSVSIAPCTPLASVHVKNYATDANPDRSAYQSEREQKTRARFAKHAKKRKDAKGRAFQDTVGYGDMLYGIEAGLSPKRALAKAKKLQPKKFTGNMAMYYANTSTDPLPVITEQNLEQMPQPHEIKTVKAIRLHGKDDGLSSAHKMIGIVSSLKDQVPHADMQLAVERSMDDSELDPRHSLPTQVIQEPSAVESAHMPLSDKELELMDQEDAAEAQYKPIWLSPEEDLTAMSPATRSAISKVRNVFSGSLEFYQPIPGEIQDYFDKKQSRKGVSPSHRTALTSATAMSVRSILSGNSSTVDIQSEVEAIRKDPSKRLSKNKVEAKPFFDYAKIVQMSGSDFVKSKRTKETDLVTALKDFIDLPQVCVVGRSNVGKSSLLNSLMGPNFNKLIVSKTPGRTQFIQMLSVARKLVVVDMPGYGYAAATPQARKAMEERIGEYLISKLPRRVFLLIDSRRGITSADIRIADSLDQIHIVYQVVLTKIDKLTSLEQMALIEKSVKDWVNRRPCAYPEVLKTSSKSRSGIDQLRLQIYTACGYTL